jgi:hypothetical protein
MNAGEVEKKWRQPDQKKDLRLADTILPERTGRCTYENIAFESNIISLLSVNIKMSRRHCH